MRLKYIGESGRSAFKRKKEHDSGHENENADNPLWKQSSIEHGGKQEYTIKSGRKIQNSSEKKSH